MSLTPVPGDDQKVFFEDGRTEVASNKTNTVYLVLPATGFTSVQRPQFVVAVRNNSKKEFVFSNENIAASTTRESSGKVVTKNLRVYGYNYLVREAKRNAAWATFGAAMQGAADSYNASMSGYSYQSGSVNTYSNTYGNHGRSYSTSGYGSYSGTTYNAAAVNQARMAAEAKTQRNYDKIKGGLRGELSALKEAYLKKQTVQPGTTHGGVVAVKKPAIPPYSQKLILTVNVQGEVHEFTVNMDKAQ